MSQSISTQILTPVGRMVQGHPFRYNTHDMKGKPLTDSDGNPRVEYFLAIAIPKTDAGFNEVWQKMQQAAASGFHNGEQNLQGFAWKYVDGDNPKNVGKEGFAGCHVLRLTGGFAPKVYTKVGAAQIVNEKEIKTGDYIRAYIDCRPNGSSLNPGLYLNPTLVELIGYGNEIVSGPDGAQIFGGAPIAQLPPGASETPTAGTPIATPTPQMPQAQTQPQMPGGPSLPGQSTPTAATPTAATPAQPIQPGAPAAMPVTPASPAPAPAAQAQPQYTMTAKAGQFTREQYHQQGWTDEQLISHGFMQQSNAASAPSANVAPAPDFLNGPQQ